MTIRLHRLVYSDIAEIMDYYERVSGAALADDFYRELRTFFKKAANQPGRFRICEGDLRRANLVRFPYHFLFRVQRDSIRVLVVRHHRRETTFGIQRS